MLTQLYDLYLVASLAERILLVEMESKKVEIVESEVKERNHPEQTQEPRPFPWVTRREWYEGKNYGKNRCRKTIIIFNLDMIYLKPKRIP